MVFKTNHRLMGSFQWGHLLAENPSAFADRESLARLSKISVGTANSFLRRAYLLIVELFILQGSGKGA